MWLSNRLMSRELWTKMPVPFLMPAHSLQWLSCSRLPAKVPRVVPATEIPVPKLLTSQFVTVTFDRLSTTMPRPWPSPVIL